MPKFSKFINDFTRAVVLDKVAQILDGANTAEIRQFLDYLEIFEVYTKNNK